jgi:hypothetical protein
MLKKVVIGWFIVCAVAMVIRSLVEGHSPSQTPTQPTSQAQDKPKPPATGMWEIGSETNDLDGAVTKFAVLKFPEVQDQVKGLNEFYLTCTKRKTEASIKPWATAEWSQLEVEDVDSNTQRVRYRIDKRKPVTQSWNVSTNYHSLFMPNSALRDIRKGNVLVIEYQPSYQTRQTATLIIDGLDASLKQMGCKL